MARTYDFRTATKDSLLPSGVTTAAGSGTTYAATANGIQLTAANGYAPSFTLSDTTLVDETGQAQWLVINHLAPVGATYAGVYFSDPSDSSKQEVELTFPVKGDGQFHTTNVWMGRYCLPPRVPADFEVTPDPVFTALGGADFKIITQASPVSATDGLMSRITCWPSFARSATGASVSGTVASIKLSDRPEGPALLICEWAGPIYAMNRVNVANPWGIRLRNGGGVRASDISLSFTASAGVTAGNVTSHFSEIPHDDDRTVFFNVTATTANAWITVTVTATCAEGDSVTFTGRAWIDAAAPTGLPAAQAPTPSVVAPAAKPYSIMIWRFPGWGPSVQLGPTVVQSFEGRPEYGFADFSSPFPHDWDIYWTVSHGIDGYIVEWIDGQNYYAKEYLGGAGTGKGLLSSKNINYIKFMLSWINTIEHTTARENRDPDGASLYTLQTGTSAPTTQGNDGDFFVNTSNDRLYGPKRSGAWDTVNYLQLTNNTSAQRFGVANFLNLIDRWREYFVHPRYMTRGGKYRVNIFDPESLYDQLTQSGTNTATMYTSGRDAFLTAALARASAIAGGSGITWDLNHVPSYQGGSSASPSTRYSTAGFVSATMYGWSSFTGPMNCIPATAMMAYAPNTQWPNMVRDMPAVALPVIGGFDHRRWKNQRNPDWCIPDWRREETATHLGQAKTFADANGITEILLCSYDEWGERSCFGPTGRTQFEWLKAVMTTFAPTVTLPTIVVPRDVSHTIPQTTGTYRWCQHPSHPMIATPDGNTWTTYGMRLRPGDYPEITPKKANNVPACPRATTADLIYPIPLMRGTNAMISAAHCIENNINCLRDAPPVTWTRVGTTGRYTPTINFTAWEATLAALPANVRVVIDPHTFPGCPGGVTCHADYPLLWYDDYTLNMVDYWDQVSRRYASWDGSRIIGYEIFNEPNQPKRANGSAFPSLVDSLSLSDNLSSSTFIQTLYNSWVSLGWNPPSALPSFALGNPDPRSWRNKVEQCVEAIRRNDLRHAVVIPMASTGGTYTTDRGGTGISMGTFTDHGHDTANWFEITGDPNFVKVWHLYAPNGYCIQASGTRPTATAIANSYSQIRSWMLANPSKQVFFTEVGSRKDASEVALYTVDILNYVESLGAPWLWHVLNYNTYGDFDASGVPDLMTALRSFWARN